MDHTSGYHQAPLSIASRILTAFITFMGVFEHLRVPMGIKGSAAYFQQVVTTVVLVVLIHIICACYQDDILTFGSTTAEFINNSREVFLCLRKHKLTVNPKKCQFGLEQIEYVGHTISQEGISISQDKREEIFTIEKPTLRNPKTPEVFHWMRRVLPLPHPRLFGDNETPARVQLQEK